MTVVNGTASRSDIRKGHQKEQHHAGHDHVNRPGGKVSKRIRPPTTFMHDGVRRIDVVLSCTPGGGKRAKRGRNAKLRRQFETELRTQGLQLEYECKEVSQDGKTAFIKVHAPFDVLARQAELNQVRKPVAICDLPPRKPSFLWTLCHRLLSGFNPFRLQKHLQYPYKEYFTDAYRRDRQHQFLGLGRKTDANAFFTPAERILLTWSILQSVRVDVEDKTKRLNGQSSNKQADANDCCKPGVLAASIEYLLETGVYKQAFALHDGALTDEAKGLCKGKPTKSWPMRNYLYEAWANPRQMFKYQPLDAIRDYYGEKVSLYFAWTGFYTQMLIAPSIVGFLVLIYGAASISTDELSQRACNETENLVICRDCPSDMCDFKYLRSMCYMARVAQVFDNRITVIFSLFMCVWAVLLVEYWIRYEEELRARWDVFDQGYTEEAPRPEYVMKAFEWRVNPVTKRKEPYVPMGVKRKRLVLSIVAVICFILIVVALIIGIMVYKIVGPLLWENAAKAFGYQLPAEDYTLYVSFSASIVNGISIAIMTKIYVYVAWQLTRAEFPRTQSEFERSYTYKIVIFQFFNFYGALFYLAFVRGQWLPAPDKFTFHSTRCPITGCLTDVTIQLAIILVGKQILNNVWEISRPVLGNWFRQCRKRMKSKQKNLKYAQWEQDGDLHRNEQLTLFSDYLELLIQYGFVTMFVAAFPLAPFFALFNNIVEIRLDAYKTVVLSQRCVPVRDKDIGVWLHLLKLFTHIAVVTSAFVLSFTTEFIPRIVYLYAYSQKANTGEDFLTYSLSIFDTSDWNSSGDESLLGNLTDGEHPLSIWTRENNTYVKYCYYRDYRQLPSSLLKSHETAEPYSATLVWWHVLLARLAFALIFEHAVFLIQRIVIYFIPAVSNRVTLRRKREEFINRQHFLQEELLKRKQDEDAMKADNISDLHSKATHASETTSKLGV